jgi:hypothetical protein
VRNTSATFRRAVSRRETGEAFLVLLTIDHPDRLPDLTDSELRGAWLNSEVAKTPDDYSSAGDDMTEVGGPLEYPAEGVTLDGSTQHLKRSEAAWRPDSLGTISAWVKPSGVGSEQVIFSSSDEAGNDKRFQLAISASDLLEVRQENADTADVVEGDTTFAADTWYHVTLVGDGASYAIYVDGVAETLTVTSGTNSGDWLGDTADRDNVMIGAYEELAGVSGDLGGTVRDVRYYSRAMSSREVFALYRAGLFTPIRVVNNTRPVVSEGKQYVAFPFQVQLPDERDDRVTGVTLRIDNVDRSIVTALRQVTTELSVSLSVILDSDPDVVEVGPYLFSLKRANYDANVVSGEMEYEDVLREPMPGHTFTPSFFPGLFSGVSS